MTSKREKLIILIIIGLVVPLLINKSINFSDNHKTIKIDLKSSGGYTESFIHVDASNPKNWSWTAGNYSWCYFKNGIYFIENVTIDASDSPTGNGIYIENSKNEYFIIRNCTIFNADYSFFDSGIWLENTNNGTIINNKCSDNYQGIYLIDCEGNTIIGNNVSNNNINGIYLDTNCEYNNITGNTVNNNLYGIQLTNNCNYNNITLNTVNNNDDYGIFINSFGSTCDNNIILNNTANENNDYGIYIRYTNFENSIINNIANDNIRIGIYMVNSYDFTINSNTINNNTRGLELQGCDDSNIMGNTINGNLEIGINLENSDSNEIKNNTINRNDLGIALDQSDYNNITGNDLKYNNWCILETNCEGNIIEYNDCTSPTVEFPIYIDDNATGVGAHNWTWAKSQIWCSGLGTDSDPYIIENLKISGFGIMDGITIQNSNVTFIIRECLIYNSDTAIYLENVNNSRLINNNCSNNDRGIYLESCFKSNIFENTVNMNAYDGIHISESDYINITRNEVNDNDDGISIDKSDFNSIIENNINRNDKGISLEECINNTISGNNANNNNKGIFLWNYCYNITIFGNIANGNDDGIYLEESHFNDIIKNTVCDNIRAGIFLDSSDSNNISGNSASGSMDGIYLENECYNNIVSRNIFNGNNEGIILYYSDFTQIIENTINNNNNLGIGLETSNNNTITGNVANNNTNYGIFLVAQSHNNTILGNKVNDNKISGIQIDDDSDYNVITQNIMENNALGIYLYSDCENNSIYKNVFLKNGKHAIDNGNYNKWNNPIIGNYWDNHTGPDTTPQDGIVDTPYTYIGGSAGSIDYLPIAEDGPPLIVIYSPSENEVFGTSAPSFSVMITDVLLDKMWYTLDGGLNNYTFTENGTINQAAWDALPEGGITLTFYARDIVGNEAFEEVTIMKRIASGGIDPTIIIVIVVVSVVGGVAVLAGVYVFMKKRATPE